MRRWAWGLPILAAAIVAWVLWASSNTGLRVPLQGNRELRILKVSLGTNHVFAMEPWWKQSLRRVLPNIGQTIWGASPENVLKTRYSVLVMWVKEVESSNGEAAKFSSFDRPAAVMPDGTTVKGRAWDLKNGITRLEFTSFARGQDPVRLQVRDNSGQAVSFSVRNPQPVRRSTHAALPLPQTNDLKHTRVVLHKVQRSPSATGEYDAWLRAHGDPTPQWVTWRVTFFDEFGNWAEKTSSSTLGSRVAMPFVPRSNSTWRLVGQGTEYISAGFPPPPTNSAFTVLSPHRRAAIFGVRFAMFFGAGVYQVTNGVVSASGLTVPPQSGLQLVKHSDSSNWSVNLVAADPGVLCVSDVAVNEPIPTLRVRERLPENSGRIFLSNSRNTISVTNFSAGRKFAASFFSPSLPATTTNLEVEVIGTLPEAEFYIASP